MRRPGGRPPQRRPPIGRRALRGASASAPTDVSNRLHRKGPLNCCRGKWTRRRSPLRCGFDGFGRRGGGSRFVEAGRPTRSEPAATGESSVSADLRPRPARRAGSSARLRFSLGFAEVGPRRTRSSDREIAEDQRRVGRDSAGRGRQRRGCPRMPPPSGTAGDPRAPSGEGGSSSNEAARRGRRVLNPAAPPGVRKGGG